MSWKEAFDKAERGELKNCPTCIGHPGRASRESWAACPTCKGSTHVDVKPNEPRDLLTWLPEAADCRFETEDDGSITCYHPSDDPRIEGLYGSGDKPVAAYAQLLQRLDDWQETELERIDKEDEWLHGPLGLWGNEDYDDIEGMYAAADDKGQMERDGA